MDSALTTDEEIENTGLVASIPIDDLINEHFRFLTLPYGRMLINSHDPCLPVNLVENIKEIEGLGQFAKGIVLDVGANVGSHAINFARTADFVYAFEPHPHTFWNLCANILINQALNVVPLNFALGNRDGDTTVWNIDPKQPNTGMGVCVDVGSLPVPMRMIDSLELERVDFIKIDVEGYEFEVLRGAHGTLMTQLPIVFVEIHSVELRDKILAYMTGHEFKNFEFVHTQYEKTEISESCTFGYLFWKGERVQWVNGR